MFKLKINLRNRGIGWLFKMALLCSVIFYGYNVAAQTYFANPSETKFLKAEDAFKANLVLLPKIQFNWDIAPGYYLYQKSFEFKLLDLKQKEIEVSKNNIYSPEGVLINDEFMGETLVFKDYVEVMPQFSPDAINRAKYVEISYQGCAEKGLCYPPKIFQVELAK